MPLQRWSTINFKKSYKEERDTSGQRYPVNDFFWILHILYISRRVIFQKISTAQNLCKYDSQLIRLASYERLNWRSTKYKFKYSLDLDCFETKRNVDDVFARASNMGNCSPSKTNVNLGFASVDIGFLGVSISQVASRAVNIYIMLPSFAGNVYYIILYVNHIHFLRSIWFKTIQIKFISAFPFCVSSTQSKVN